MDGQFETEEMKALSALQENIQKKGKNAYYYAHGPKIDGPAWDGKEEPRLMATSSPATSSSFDKCVTFSSFESFAWLDGSKNVKVYVDFDCACELLDEDVILNSTSNAVDFSVCKDQKHYKLVLDNLSGSIVNATVKKKSDKFVITLIKEAETAWFELRKTKT
jgi:hypothetical protein